MRHQKINIFWVYWRQKLPLYIAILGVFIVMFFIIKSWIQKFYSGSIPGQWEEGLWDMMCVGIMVIVLVLGSTSVASEKEQGSLRFLLRLPVRREVLLVSRWIVDFLFISILFLLLIDISPLDKILLIKYRIYQFSSLKEEFAALFSGLIYIYFLSSLMSALLNNTIVTIVVSFLASLLLETLITFALIDSQNPLMVHLSDYSVLYLSGIWIFSSIVLFRRMSC